VDEPYTLWQENAQTCPVVLGRDMQDGGDVMGLGTWGTWKRSTT